MAKHNAELREMTMPELQTRLSDAHQELFNLRVQQANHQLTNSQRLGQVRREVARLNTILRERELAEAS
jgi:large subunit ribosomal protein L29